MSLISDVKTDVNMREVTFSITAEDLEAACERVYQRQKKDIAVKGFRKGKVPRKMVEKLYGEEVFFEDAVNMIIPGELDAILRDKEITIIDRPSVELVSCSKGRVIDVAVDIRKGSPTFGKWVSVELSAENHRQFLIPRGFAHGFLTLTDDVEFRYKCDNVYNKASEGGMRYDAP